MGVSQGALLISGELGGAPWGCQEALEALIGLPSGAFEHLWADCQGILGVPWRLWGIPWLSVWCPLAAWGEKVLQIQIQDGVNNQPKLEIACLVKTYQQLMFFRGFGSVLGSWMTGALRSFSELVLKEMRASSK